MFICYYLRMRTFYIFFVAAMLFTLRLSAQTTLISFGSSWKYLDNGSNQGTAWRGISFSDGSWKTGNGKFGYGITGTATTIKYGTNVSQKYTTTYFRKKISITNASAYTYYTASVKRDDGVVVYVNGVEVYRNNMPTGTIAYSTFAANATDNGTANQIFNIKASAFISGNNVVAVEIHQNNKTTSDMAFDMTLAGNADFTAPAVASINRQSPTTATTSATSVTYRITFSEKVSGVNTADFTLTKVSGTVSGAIASVAASGTTGTIYDAKISSITGNGILRLDLKSTGTGITDQGGNAIKGGYSSGQTYTIQPLDVTAPAVLSINRQAPLTDTTSATSVIFRATFSEKVNGVDAADFTATNVSGSVNGSIAAGGVAQVGATGNIYDITVSQITGEGILGLDLNSAGTGITDTAGNVIGRGYTSGETYTVPTAEQLGFSVLSIKRQLPLSTTTSATSVTYRVTFVQKVNGVDVNDFTVKNISGSVTGSIANDALANVGTTGDTYDVTISSITGTGDLRLDLNSVGTDITDEAGNAISGGYTSGETYTILPVDQTAPFVANINRQSPLDATTGATSVTYRITFSETVTGVDVPDFTVTKVSGTVTGSVASNGVIAVGALGDTYDVTVSSITGTGDLRLDLNSTGTGITDASGNAITEGYSSGETYTIPDLPPNAPVSPSPADGGYLSSASATLCTTVSDPNNSPLRVRFYGRKKVTPSKFTIIMIPDTQVYTEQPQGTSGAYNTMFKSQTSWIVNNRTLKNIAYVGHLGDCVEHGDSLQVEWQRVDTAMKSLESYSLTGLTQGIPYGVCVGNHDQSPNGSAKGTTTFYNQYFGISRFNGRSYYGGHNSINNDNHFELFSAGGIDFLVISPEYDQTTAFSAAGGTLDWIESLVKSYPNRKVIVMSHLVVNGDVTFSAQGKAIYDRLKIYPNFILMFGGHISGNTGEVKRSDTYNGRTVHSLVSDYQSRTNGGNGLLRIYEFDPLNNNLSVQTYSPYTKAYETDANSQFNLPVDLASGINTNSYSLIGEVSNVASGNNVCVNWPSLEQNTDYEWYAEVFDGQSTTTGPAWSFTTNSTAQNKVNNNSVHIADIAESPSDHLFTLYPNPNYTHELTLKLNSRPKEAVLVEVMDVSGHLQIKKEFKNVGMTIALKHKLAAGTYIIKMQEGQHQEVKEFIVVQ